MTPDLMEDRAEARAQHDAKVASQAGESGGRSAAARPKAIDAIVPAFPKSGRAAAATSGRSG